MFRVTLSWWFGFEFVLKISSGRAAAMNTNTDVYVPIFAGRDHDGALLSTSDYPGHGPDSGCELRAMRDVVQWQSAIFLPTSEQVGCVGHTCSDSTPYI